MLFTGSTNTINSILNRGLIPLLTAGDNSIFARLHGLGLTLADEFAKLDNRQCPASLISFAVTSSLRRCLSDYAETSSWLEHPDVVVGSVVLEKEIYDKWQGSSPMINIGTGSWLEHPDVTVGSVGGSP